MSRFATTPAGIMPFGDPNWQRLAAYLIGPSSNGIGLDANGSLLLMAGSGTTSLVGGTAPIVVSGSQVSLAYTSPLTLSGGTLTVGVAAPIYLTGGNVGLNATSPFYVSSNQLKLACDGALLVNGSRLSLTTVAPLGQAGGILTIGISDGIETKAPFNYIGVKVGFGLSVDGSGVSLDETDTGDTDMSGTSFTWAGAGSPSSLSYARYRAVLIGNVVTVWFKIVYNNAGSNNTEVTFPLPSVPANPAVWNSTDNVEIYGAGHLGTSSAGGAGTGAGGSAIYWDGGQWVVSIHTSAITVNAKAAWGTLTYVA